MSATLSHPIGRPLDEHDDSRQRAARLGAGAAAVAAIVGSLQPGLGLAIAVSCFVLATARVVGTRTRAGLWCASWMLSVPWLIVRDNRWLAICIAATTALVAAFGLAARASGQSLDDFSALKLFRRPRAEPAAPVADPVASWSGMRVDRRLIAVVRGLAIAAPILWAFAMLLGSADAVFASFLTVERDIDAPAFPIERLGWFLLLLAAAVPALQQGSANRGSVEPVVKRKVGELESSIVLGSVCALFSLFIVIRLASFGREFSNELLRGEVRGGFFQLLWVAALTVALVLALRRDAGAMLTGRVRALGVATVGLAGVIDTLALVRIVGYVRSSFHTPLRFWSFGFGLWLLVVLVLVALRVVGVGSDRRWFSLGLVSSWMIFVVAMALANPDAQVASYNFDPATREPGQPISVIPLMGLSDDATPIIVENIEVLRPMTNDRFIRMRDHLCDNRVGDGWRDWHWSRNAAQDPLDGLCGTG